MAEASSSANRANPVSFNRQWAEERFAEQSAALAPGLPFSFVLDGQPSSAFLHEWARRLQVTQVDATRVRRVLTLTDPKSGLEVEAVAIVYLDTPGVDWTLHFTQRGSGDSPVIEDVRPVDVKIHPGLGATPILRRLRGSTCSPEDWLPFDEALMPGKSVEFGAINGRSSAESPFFTVDWGRAGVITTVGWSGQWRGTVGWGPDSGVSIQAGMQVLRTRLHPGETLRSPRILQLYWSGEDPFVGYNLFRQTLLRHVVPQKDGLTITPPMAHLSTAFYEMNATTEANVLSHLDSIKGLGFEVFWLDAYWTRDGFPAGMGHYGFPITRAEPPDRFPHGLKPVSEAVHKDGMKFLMWFEPERVHPGTEISREHPEWVISPGQDGSGLYNLGIPEAREYMTKYLQAVIREYGLDWLRIDFNIDPWPFWEFLNAQDPERVGMGEIRYVEGLYQMWDDLLSLCPGLCIDNCASGGRRIDLETCSRSIPLWRSDNTCDMVGSDPERIRQAAIKNQVMSAGLNRYLPFSTVGQMGADPYFFLSGFNGGIAFAEDCRPSGYPRDLLKAALREGESLRKYWFGDFYVLSDVNLDPKSWCVLQYHLPAQGEGIVIGFRRDQSPYASFCCELRGIEPDARYQVASSQGYRQEKPVRMKGSELKDLKIAIEDRPGAIVVEYRVSGK